MTRMFTILATIAIAGLWISTMTDSPDGESVILACIVTAVTYAILAIANRD